MLSIEERSSILEDVVQNCQYILQYDQIATNAKVYLDSRIPKQFQKQFQFGFFPTNNDLSFLTSLTPLDNLKKTNIVYPKIISGGSALAGHFHHHNLIFPMRDAYNNIISLVGRTFHNKQTQEELQIPKYKYSLGLNKELHLFGLNNAKSHIIKQDFVILVEGQLDYFSCLVNGISNVVAVGGSSFTKHQFFKLRRYTKNMVMLLDNDEAGQRGIAKAKKYFGNYANISSKSLPEEFKDIDETLSNTDGVRKEQIINNLRSI